MLSSSRYSLTRLTKEATGLVSLPSLAPLHLKPCVSFGQDNGTVYCTVPATSTQGAVKAEDKAKQAVGGVQLVRLSFPPSLDTVAAARVLHEAVAAIYSAQ